MKKLIALLMVAFVLSAPDVGAEGPPASRQIGAEDSVIPREINGWDFVVAQAALPAALKHAPWMEIKNYRISVYDHRDLYIVIFDPLDRPRGTLGSGEKPSVEVALSRDSLQVVQTGYSR